MLWPRELSKNTPVRLSWPKLAKARSGLALTFHRWEKKLAVSFGLYNSPRLLDVAQESRLSPSGDVLLQPQLTCWQLKSPTYRLGCELRDGRWCESRAWRFVGADDLVSCDVYALPLSLWLLCRLIDQWPFQPLMDKRGKAVIPAQDWPIWESLRTSTLGITSLSAVVHWVSCRTMMKALFL